MDVSSGRLLVVTHSNILFIFFVLQTHISEDEGVDTDDQPLMDDAQRRLQLLVVDNELEYNESMIVQREDEIREIEQGITELNEIFRDLGAMVHEQGSMLGKKRRATPSIQSA